MKLLKLSIVALSLSVVIGCKKKDEDPKPPTITGLSATTGNANASITITGANFSTTPASNTVKFGDTQAEVTAATATSLTVKVPNGSTKGKVSVKVGTFAETIFANDFTTTSYVDTRDSQEYGQVQVGNQWWMTRNLNWDAPSGDFCYQDNVAKCTQYGKMYDWATANTACPTGWKLPSEGDYNTLVTALGGATAAKTALVGTSSSSGLGVLYSGVKLGVYANEGSTAYLWTSTESSSTSRFFLIELSVTSVSFSDLSKSNSICIRCIKN